MRGFALSSSHPDVTITEPMATALVENLRRCARHWLSFLAPYWDDPDDTALLWSERADTTDDLSLVCVEVVPGLSAEGNLAEHDRDAAGRPRCRIFWDAIRAQGGTLCGPGGLTSAISHELCETLVDPSCVRTVSTMFGRLNPAGKDEPLEVCDRVQGSDYCEPTSPGIFVANSTSPAFWCGAGQPDIRSDVEASPVLTSWVQLAEGYHEEIDADGTSRLVFGERVSDFTITRLLRQGPRAGKRRRK